MKLFDVYPLYDIEIARAAGSVVWDTKGQAYTDLYGGHAVISIGHSHPHYISRLSTQLNKIGFYSNSVHISQQVELAEKLGELSGKENYQLFLCNSGAEANENALKLASFHTGRKHVIAFTNSFHGRTSLAVSVTDNRAIQAPINENTAVSFLALNDIEGLKNEFAKHEICAVIIEGIQGVGGIHVASNEFLQTIRTLCDQAGAVFIADSVQCGYGRSGEFFAHDFSGIDADIYSMAKGMGNGFPIGGILVADHIKARHQLLGTTFGGNYLACAAANAVLEVMKEEDLMARATQTGNFLIGRLSKIEGVKEVRGRGLMIGIDLNTDSTELRKKLLYKHHIFTGSASSKSVIRLLPALNLPIEMATHFLDVFEELMQTENARIHV